MIHELPAFIGSGMFRWNADGYRFAKPAPPLLSQPAVFESSDPWIILAASLMRAQQGDFSQVSRVIACMRTSKDAVLSRSCAFFLGDAGSTAVLKEAIDRLFHVDECNLCYSLRGSHYLWVVPHMLEVYFSMLSRRDVDIIPVLISELLEPTFGEVSEVVIPDDQYRALVLRKRDELRIRFGTDNVPVNFGDLFSVRKVALMLREHLKAHPVHSVLVAELRHQFEASTGIDCSSFFKDRRVQPLTAIAVVEEFLSSSEIEKYEDGVRYFFGHRIPH